MAIYSEDTIQEVINMNDIIDIVSGYVQLKRAGRNYMGLCPFHREKTPSFVVSPEKQIFHCFGCGEGGNVVAFIMKVEGLIFVEALEFLANRVGITLKPINNYVDKNKDIKEKIYLINMEVSNLFQSNLYSEFGTNALKYLYNRKLDDNTIKKFKLGYSRNTNELFQYLKNKGFSEDEILKSAVVEKKDNRYLDKFRNRLMFPIFDTRDRIIAFGGRVMDDSKPKYINSPETLVYSKGKTLFALNIVKKEKVDKIIIVEGYMDAISLHQRGVNNVVASLGTALTEEQGRLIRRYTSKTIIGYDADSAGQNATLRGMDILNLAGCTVKVLKLDADDVKDPDEYIIKYGSGRFNNLVKKAITLIEFKLQVLLKQYNINNIDEKIRFLNEMAKVLSNIDNNMEQDVYINIVCEMTGITTEAITAEIKKIKFKYANDLKNASINKVQVKTKEKNDNKMLTEAEKYIIFLLLEKNIDIYNMIKNCINVEDFENNQYKKIVLKLFQSYISGNYLKEDFINLFDNEEINIVTSTICLDYNMDNVERIIFDISKTIKKNKLENRKKEILELLKNKEENKEELEFELNKILIDLNKI